MTTRFVPSDAAVAPAVARALARHGRGGPAGRAAVEAYQAERLRALLAHAAARVPYQRERFRRHGLDPAAIRGVADLASLPPISKRDLQAVAPAALVAEGLDPEALPGISSSGSTGEPFTFRRSWLEINLHYLFRLRALRSLGQQARDRVVHLHSKDTADGGRCKWPGRLLGRLGLWRLSHVDVKQSPEAMAAALRTARPDLILGYPSALTRIAALAPAARAGVRPRLVVTGAEVLTEGARRCIAEAFGAPVRNIYASSECHLMAWECPAGAGLHVCDDSVVLEVLVDGRPARPGETGEAVVTALHAWTMPLVRYRLGDLVTRGESPCPCGAPFASIRAVEGRIADYLTLPDGRVVHPYQVTDRVVWNEEPWVRQFQLVQHRPDHVEMQVVPSRIPGADQLARARGAVAEVLGPGVVFELRTVPEIAPDRTGKVRAFRPGFPATPVPRRIGLPGDLQRGA
ncbi:MAG TPA: hypothetical protein VFS40_08330 [Gemmatimonadales bacterium]|nr:hypothetical protein [Gemmatimonadales bacterium]